MLSKCHAMMPKAYTSLQMGERGAPPSCREKHRRTAGPQSVPSAKWILDHDRSACIRSREQRGFLAIAQNLIVAPYGPFSLESIEYTRIIRCTVYTPYTVFSKNTCNMGSRSTASSEYTHIIRCTVCTPYTVQCNYAKSLPTS